MAEGVPGSPPQLSKLEVWGVAVRVFGMAIVSMLVLLLALVGAHIFVGAAVPAYALPVFTACGLAAALGAAAGIGRRPLPRTLQIACATAFALYVAGRAWFSPVEYLARADLTAVTACFAVYLLVALLFTPARWRLSIVWVLIGLGIAATGIGAVQFLHANNWMPFGFERADYGARASGFYICPNHTAGYLEMVAMFAFALAVFGRFGVMARLLIAYLAVMLLAGVAITGSRGGYLSTLCGLGTFAILTLILVGRKRPGLLVGVFAAVILLSSALWFGAPALLHRHTGLSKRLDRLVDTRNNRLQMWEAALDQYRQSPVIGTGAGSYLYFGRYFRPEGGYKEDPIHAHGDYMELLGEYGTVGGILGVALLISHGVGGMVSALGVQVRRLREETLSSMSLALTVGALAALATQIAHAVVDFNMHIPANALVMAVVLGILANPGIATTQATGSRRAWMRRSALAACGVLAACLGARHIVSEWHQEKARVAMAQERWADAAAAAKQGLRHDPRNPDLHGALGEARLYRSAELRSDTAAVLLLEGARLDLERALRLFPGDIWRWIALGQTLDSLERFDEARLAYDEAIRNSPNWGIGYASLGLHFERQGRVPDALAMYDRAATFGTDSLSSDGARRMRAMPKPVPLEPGPEP